MGSMRDRMRSEISAAAAAFSTSKRASIVAGRAGHAWVIIMDFPLPAGYNRELADVAVLLPPRYPNVPPDGFFLESGLRRNDGRIPHYFEQGFFTLGQTYPPIQNRRDENWAWACLHIREWRPAANFLSGDSLVTVCRLAHDALVRWAR